MPARAVAVVASAIRIRSGTRTSTGMITSHDEKGAMGYLTRGPTSNDPPPDKADKSPWLEEDDLMDEIALLLSGLAKRCAKCRRSTRTKHLEQGQCPDCRPGAPP
jgi:hypothetical protein